MKNLFVISFCILLISCFSEPKKEIKNNYYDKQIIEKQKENKYNNIPKTDSSYKLKYRPIEGTNNYITLETFENDSKIYSDYEGCGCYFSIDKDNFIADKKYVFFGEILGKNGNSIELIIDNKIEKLFCEGSKETSNNRFVTTYSNSKHLVAIALKRENIENEETTYWSGSITVDNKYFSLIFGMCGC